MVKELSNIKNIDKIILSIHGEKLIIDLWRKYFDETKPTFEIKLYEYENSNYLDRINNAHKTDCTYSCKIDDDVLISRHVWDFIIENLESINDDHPIIAPILTNGMPSVDLFIRDFLSSEDLKIAHSLLLSGRIQENLWGLDYSKINEKLKSMEVWDPIEYWKFVSRVDTKWHINQVPFSYFIVRGVHPARFSSDFNIFICEKIFENLDKFFGKNDYSFETFKTPYFTNNMFVSTTKYWIDTLALAHDGWDEGQLSLKMLIDNSSVLYVKNGFGIHMAYGMTDNQMLIEKTYIENILKIL
jgi:hypothetical protein